MPKTQIGRAVQRKTPALKAIIEIFFWVLCWALGSKLHYLFVLCKNPSAFTYFRNKMEALPIDIDAEIVIKYNLDEEQENVEMSYQQNTR